MISMESDLKLSVEIDGEGSRGSRRFDNYKQAGHEMFQRYLESPAPEEPGYLKTWVSLFMGEDRLFRLRFDIRQNQRWVGALKHIVLREMEDQMTRSLANQDIEWFSNAAEIAAKWLRFCDGEDRIIRVAKVDNGVIVFSFTPDEPVELLDIIKQRHYEDGINFEWL